MTITPEDLVRREVHYCASALISTLAQGAIEGRAATMSHDLANLWEQAFELSSPVPDYESAAIDASWEEFTDEFSVKCWRETSPDSDDADGMTWAGSAEDVCREFDIEPYDREVFEHWIVSDWLAEKLAARGEKTDKDFAGLTIWARTTTGQAISMDSVIADICADVNRPFEERLAEIETA